MNNKTLVLLAASLFATSALASEGTSNVAHAHKHHKAAAQHHHVVAPVVAPVAAPVSEESKEHFVLLEGTYNFNLKKVKLNGLNYTSRKVDDGGSFGLGVGMNVNENFSVDATLSYVLPAKAKLGFSSNEKYVETDVKTDSYRLLLNGRYTMKDLISDGVSPFVTAGLGASYNHTKVSSTNGSAKGHNTQFAYQAGAGLTVKAADDVSIDLAYRWADNGKFKNLTINNYSLSGRNLQSHEVVLGLRYGF